jgi:hypothetical protein
MDDDQDGLLSRRRLLETGAQAIAGVALLGTDAFAAPQRGAAGSAAPSAHDLREGYRRARFEPHVGTTVQLRAPGVAALLVQLAAVEDVAQVKGLAGAPDAYVLRFRGPAAQPLAEGIVDVRSERFGMLQLHIVPGPAVGTTQDYIAAINRRIPHDAAGGKRRRRQPALRYHSGASGHSASPPDH